MNATPVPASISPLAIAIASILYGGSTLVSVPARADNTTTLEEVVVTAERAGFYKPHPEPYRAVLAAQEWQRRKKRPCRT